MNPVIIGDCTLYLGDCLEVMKSIPDKSIDAVITDPPYGINADIGVGGFGSSPETAKHYSSKWDMNIPDNKYFTEIIRLSNNQFIFSGQFFTGILPISGHWIVWDKVGEIKFQNPFGDCELIWTSIDKKSVRKYVCIQQGFVSKEKERFHPTQKPTQLIRQIVLDYINEDDTIFDPFMGSGTTGVACVQTGRKFIGIEIDEKYSEIACKRIKDTQQQIRLPFGDAK